ncbi:hypothetical protein [Martelella mangrovi]|uniref:Uncharacterized protein n=1 Tax=Martelella mangrovi TaxID=1397477 RepID=A0ABV2IFJ1_9HYPH
MVTWLLILGPNDSLHETGLLAITGMTTSLLLGYFGFATLGDRDTLKHRRPRP